MKRNLLDPVVTQSRLDKQTDVLLEKFQEYRNEILDRMDRDAANYEQLKEDKIFIESDMRELKERVSKLEHSSKFA